MSIQGSLFEIFIIHYYKIFFLFSLSHFILYLMFVVETQVNFRMIQQSTIIVDISLFICKSVIFVIECDESFYNQINLML